MVELKVYLWGRLMMDPTQNITALTQEFLEGYYSAAAAPHAGAHTAHLVFGGDTVSELAAGRAAGCS